ncbi:MAG: ATP-binding protein [Pseudomonadota bacterium]
MQTPTFEDLEKRVIELEKQVSKKTFSEQLTQTLFHISDAVNTFTDLNKLYPFIYQALDQIMGLPNFYIAVIEKHSSFIQIPFYINQYNRLDDPEISLFDTGDLVREVLTKSRPLVLDKIQLEKRIKTKQTTSIPEIWMGVPLIQRKRPVGVIAIFNQDDPDAFDQKDMDILITVSHQIALAIERKQSFDELDMIKNYLTNIINSMPSILVGVDKNMRITQWNLQAELETGVKAADAKAQNLIDVFPRLSNLSEQIKESIQYRKIRTRLKQEYNRDQEKRYEDIIIYPLVSNGVEGAVIRIDDITEQVRMEEMVTQSEKMLSIGGFAAGMAHELNNPLSGMMQNAQVVFNRVAKDLPANEQAAREVGITMADIHAYMEKRNIPDKLLLINETGGRAARIIKNMLSFAKKSDTILACEDLALILKNTIELAKNDYDLQKKYNFGNIKIVNIFEKISPVPCDKDKIQQVFFNIIKNGTQAIFSIKDEAYSPQFIFRLYKQDKMACVEIENNGPKINEQAQKRLFEPFYSTKSTSEGTGLGLSISYFIIVTDHHGEMAVESTPDSHTRFIIKLPY